MRSILAGSNPRSIILNVFLRSRRFIADFPFDLFAHFGLGLGLYAGRIIARKMGGDLSIAGANDDPAGNVFVLSIPAAEVP